MHEFASTPKAVTIREAASIARRSQSWIRSYRDLGALEAAPVGTRQGVTLDSLEQLLRTWAWAGRRSTRRRVQLVVDNTKGNGRHP